MSDVDVDKPSETPPSTGEVAPPLVPSKVVIFRNIGGVWQAEVQVNDETKPFTDRDFNQLSTLLTVRRAGIRREAALAYRRRMIENHRIYQDSKLKKEED